MTAPAGPRTASRAVELASPVHPRPRHPVAPAARPLPSPLTTLLWCSAGGRRAGPRVGSARDASRGQQQHPAARASRRCSACAARAALQAPLTGQPSSHVELAGASEATRSSAANNSSSAAPVGACTFLQLPGWQHGAVAPGGLPACSISRMSSPQGLGSGQHPSSTPPAQRGTHSAAHGQRVALAAPAGREPPRLGLGLGLMPPPLLLACLLPRSPSAARAGFAPP
jgi:hypothetical protein